MSFSRTDCVMTAPDTGMVIVVAAFAADGNRLFHAMTDPAEITLWWGGRRGGSSVTWRGRPEVGSDWFAEGVFSRGRTFSASGTFLEIDRGKRFIQSWHASWDELIPTEASLRFEPIGGGTVLSLVHKGFLGRDSACQAQAQLWWKVIKWMRPYLQDQTDQIRSDQISPASR